MEKSTTQQNVSLHVRSIVEEGELTLEATRKEFLLVQTEGQKQVSRRVDHYNLDMTLSIGCVGYETINPGEARIQRLFVKPELKRQGVGSALMQTLEKHIREKGYTKISIHTGDEKYWESKLFYKAKGFVETRPNILERNFD